MLSKRIDVKRSESERTFKCMPTLKQSFMTAGKHFKAIDAPTQSLLVKYAESEDLIGNLCSLDEKYEALEFYKALKSAQSYSVNVFEHTWNSLFDVGGIQQIGDTGVFYTDYYDSEFGLSEKSEQEDYVY